MDPQTRTCSASEPYVEILIQPAFANYFRYTCETENKCRGRIVGVNSTAQTKQYPTIQVCNYTGEFTLIVSCVTCDGPPHRPHPHKLCGSHCGDGIFSRKVATSSYSFTDLTIQCVRKNQIEESLKLRRN
ncbi:Transcription factor p65, partial [Stegodyphus mimosarum]